MNLTTIQRISSLQGLEMCKLHLLVVRLYLYSCIFLFLGVLLLCYFMSFLCFYPVAIGYRTSLFLFSVVWWLLFIARLKHTFVLFFFVSAHIVFVAVTCFLWWTCNHSIDLSHIRCTSVSSNEPYLWFDTEAFDMMCWCDKVQLLLCENFRHFVWIALHCCYNKFATLLCLTTGS